MRSSRVLVAVVAFIIVVVFIPRSISFAQSPRLPFIGTQTFCGDLEGMKAIITINKDGFTKVKTNIYTEGWESGTPRYITFSGRISAKGIVKRSRDYYLKIKSSTDIVMYVGQDFVEGKPCKEQVVQ